MRNTIIIIAGVVVIAAMAFFVYTIQQSEIRKKELDKKMSDNLEQQKQINELIRKKLESNELNVVGMVDGNNFFGKVKSKKNVSTRSTTKKVEEKKNVE